MRPNRDSLWTIRWGAATPTKTACFLQAVLLAGVFAIVVTLAAQRLVTVPAMLVQLVLFAIALPAIWLLLERPTHGGRGSRLKVDSTVPEIEFTPERVTCLVQQRGVAAGSALSVESLVRHGAAWTVKLKPQSGGAPAFDITIWRTQVDKDTFRRLVVLTAWHAENSV